MPHVELLLHQEEPCRVAERHVKFGNYSVVRSR